MIVTLMVNSSCNLRCQHCYLPANRPNILLSKDVIHWVLSSDQVRGVILTGMEPLMNQDVATVSSFIGKECCKRGLSFSVITNGMTLSRSFAQPVLESIVASNGTLDVSLDGGPVFYDRKGGDYNHHVNGLSSELSAYQTLHICILHTLWKGWSKERVDDSLHILSELPQIHRAQFSLYVDVDPSTDTRSNHCLSLTTLEAMRLLVSSRQFMSDARCVFLLDEYNMRITRATKSTIMRDASEACLPIRACDHTGHFTGHLMLAGDPIDQNGYLRIHPIDNQTSVLLSPWDSLHATQYLAHGLECDLLSSFDHIASKVIMRYRSRYPS